MKEGSLATVFWKCNSISERIGQRSDKTKRGEPAWGDGLLGLYRVMKRHSLSLIRAGCPQTHYLKQCLWTVCWENKSSIHLLISFCLLFFPRGKISKFWKVSLFASKGKIEQGQKKGKASVHLLFGENRPVTTANIICGGWPQPCGRPSRPHGNPGNSKCRRLWWLADFHWRVL